MLHASILPYEENWRQCADRSNIYSCADPDFVRFLKNLKLVAVDELHYYSGVFGTCVWIRFYPITDCCSFSIIDTSLTLCVGCEEFARPLEVSLLLTNLK